MERCDHLGDFHYEKMRTVSGVWNVFRICDGCGLKYGSAVSLKAINESIDGIPVFDKERDERIYAEICKRRDEDYAKKRAAKEIEYGSLVRQDKEKFFEWYSQYLKTEKWKVRRDLVLERDKHLCQSCLTEKATQVHHTTYKHVGNEPLFELVSVCESCHEQITRMDRSQ